MTDLPARPSLDHLRREARDLLRAAQAGDPAAAGRIRAVSAAQTLASAQLALAREYGFASWARLKAEVEARTTDLARQAEVFCRASIGDGTGRAARMLAARPELAGYNLATAVILGDAARVRAELARDPGLATRVDARSGWTALHAACASRWHVLDPARAGGLLAVARLLLDAGADPGGRAPGRPGRGGGWTPLRCAVAGAANPQIVGLLLERGAVPDDHDLYLAGFGGDDHQSLRLLLRHAVDVAGRPSRRSPRRSASATPKGCGCCWTPGPIPAATPPTTPSQPPPPTRPSGPAARTNCSTCCCPTAPTRAAPAATGARRIPGHRRGPRRPGRGAAPSRRRRRRHRRRPVPSRLPARRPGRRGDQLARDPGLPGRLGEDQQAAAMIRAAESGHAAALTMMLDLGFPVDARAGDHGGTALHAAAYAGSAEAVRLLLARGADLEARDATWDSTPLDWACVGSGERPTDNPRPDWLATAAALLGAGASTEGITLAPDDPKPPSPEVAALLRVASAR